MYCILYRVFFTYTESLAVASILRVVCQSVTARQDGIIRLICLIQSKVSNFTAPANDSTLNI